MKKRVRRKIPVSVYAMALSLLVSVLIFICTKMQIDKLEAGMVDVCAEQQDTYVELVVKQINLVDNRTSAEMIEKILSTLDSSTNKYWTLSSGQELLFVKDVMETNKYKGFTTSTYYISDSAKDFLERLTLNRVKHDVIFIDQKAYIASGVLFAYNGQEYKICLLTNKSVILDNNMFLEAKVSILTLLSVIMMILVLSSVGFSYRIEKEQKRKKNLQLQLIDAQYRLSISTDDQYAAVQHDRINDVWGSKMLPIFVEKLQQKKCAPVTVVSISCKDKETTNRFLEKAKEMFDKNMIRFRMSDTEIIVLCIQLLKGDATWNLVPAVDDEIMIQSIFEVHNVTDLNMIWIFEKLYKGEE